MLQNRDLGSVQSDRKSPILTSLSKDLIYNSDRIIGAIASTPASTPDPAMGDIMVIGGIVQFGSSSNRTINQIGEIGSEHLYVTVVDGQKTLSIGRQLIDTSLLRAFYATLIDNSDNNAFKNQKILFDLDHPVFSEPIDIYDIVRTRDTEGIQTAVDTTVYKYCQIASNTIPVMQGNDEISESARFLYSSQEGIENF